MHLSCVWIYELESSRLSSRRSIRFGMREARRRNCGSKQCSCCHQLCPYSFGGLLGRNPPLANKKDQNAFSDSYPYPERGILPNTKNKEGGGPPRPLTILLAHSSPHLPKNERSLVPGASSLLSLDDSRLCKIYSEYEICNMQYVEGVSCWTGWV